MPYSLRSDIAPHREAGGAIRFLAHNVIAPCHRHVVNHPLVHVVFLDTVIQELQLLSVAFRARVVYIIAQELAVVH